MELRRQRLRDEPCTWPDDLKLSDGVLSVSQT